MGWIEIASLVLNLVLGTGLIVTVATLRSVKAEAAANAKKAAAGATASEIKNVEAVIKLWREMAEKMAQDRETLVLHVEELSTEVRRLKNATNRVVRLLDKITPENMEETVNTIKKEIDNEYTSVSGNLHDLANRVQSSTTDNKGADKNS